MYASPFNRPPGYYDYNTSTPPPPTSGYYANVPPRYASTAFQGAKTHNRRASQQVPAYSARVPPGYQPSPLRGEPVSRPFDYDWGQTRSSRAPKDGTRRSNGKHSQPSHADPRFFSYRYMYDVVVDEQDYVYNVYHDAPPPYEAQGYYHDDRFAGADPYDFYHQERSRPVPPPQPEPMTPKANQSRPRRASYTPRPQPSPKPKQSPNQKTRVATAEDARRANIPAGYSLKNWDPAEEPIILLGSVFDANSLGKWIYDWTTYSYGPATPMADVAGDLWLLLIQLSGKNKRADEAIDKIRQEEKRELVEDFLESGERLWVRFKKLLKICEEYMWKAAQRDQNDKRPVTMGKNSGCEFVDSIFGRDRELDKTEKLMSNIRLWSMRFDANCDEIIRNPTE